MNWVKQNYFKYAMIMNAFMVFMLLYMHLTGERDRFPGGNSTVEAFFVIVVPLAIWHACIRAKRKELGGAMTFKQGLKEGFNMGVAFGLTSPFLFLIYYVFINPDILLYVAREYRMTGVSVQTVIAVDMIAQFAGSIVMGTIYGAIISFFLKTS